MENANNNNKSRNSRSSRNNSNDSNNGATLRRIASKPSRCASREYLPADLFMEPLLPPSPSKSPNKVRHRSPWVPEETTGTSSQQDLVSERQKFEQGWWPFCIGNLGKHNTPTNRWTSTFESVFADGGISIRVQHHPLESSTTEEEEDEDASQASEARDSISVSSPEFCEEIVENARVRESDPSDEGFARTSQHSESLENVEPGELPATQAKSAIEQDSEGLPIAATPRSSKLGGEALADPAKKLKPSLSPSRSRPVIAASSNSWIQPDLLATTGGQREMLERGLWSSMPKGNELAPSELSFRLWECQETPKRSESQDNSRNGFPTSKGVGDDEVLKQQPQPPPPLVDAHEIQASLNFRWRRRRRRGAAATSPSKVTPSKVEIDSEQDYPSPSSFTCDLSPTSLFSDDQDLSISSSDDSSVPSFPPVRSRRGGISSSREEIRTGFRKSPRSVLSQEPDEISHESSDSSEPPGLKQQQQKPQEKPPPPPPPPRQQQQTPSAFTFLYNDESSDLESPMHAKFRHQLQQQQPPQAPFPAFTYIVGQDMAVTSSSSSEDVTSSEADEEEGKSVVAGSFHELGFFPEAIQDWESSIGQDGGAWYDSEDLEFLPSSDSEGRNDTTKRIVLLLEEASQRRIGFPSLTQSSKSEEMAESADGETELESPRIEHDSLETELESLKPELDSPKTKQESPPMGKESLRRLTSENKWIPLMTSSLHGDNPPRVRNSTRGGSQPRNPSFDKTIRQGKASVPKPSPVKTPRRTVNFAADLVKEIPYSQSQQPETATQDRKQYHLHLRQQQQLQPRANPNVQETKQEAEETDVDPFVSQSKVKSKSSLWEVEADVEEGPSIMNSRRRWRRNRDGEEDSKAKSSSYLGGGSASWSFSESRFFRFRERVGGRVPSCVGRLISWPRKFAVKVKSSSRRRDVDSDDDDDDERGEAEERSFAGERSFGNSSRRDAELVRRILKGSHKKYSNLTGDDILKDDFEKL